jgi:hypothetical protein
MDNNHRTFDEDKIFKNQEFEDFKLVYTFLADGKFELHLSDDHCNMKFLGTYYISPHDKEDCDVNITHFQINDHPMKNYTKTFTVIIFDDGETLECGYSNDALKEMIEKNYSYPKFFEKDKIYDEILKLKDFKFILNFSSNGNFELKMNKVGIKLSLSGTYERDPHNKNCKCYITKAKKDEESEIAYNYEFLVWWFSGWSEQVTLWNLDDLIKELAPLSKWFSEDTVEKNRHGEFSITYSFFANGKFEMLMAEPKCKLILLGTYEKHPSEKTQIQVCLTQFKLNENPINEHLEKFEVQLEDGNQEFKVSLDFGKIVHLLYNSSFDLNKLETGKPFPTVCHAENHYYNRNTSNFSYESEDLVGFFYSDGTVKIKTHLEDYEDWGTDYSMTPQRKDYSATGNYVFLEKTTDGDILVRITQIESENFDGKEIEAKIVHGSFNLFIKGEKFINQKFYY